MAQCCKAMEEAVSEQYVEALYTYTDDKQRVPLGVGIPQRGKPIFIFNLCPWCGTKQVTSSNGDKPPFELVASGLERMEE